MTMNLMETVRKMMGWCPQKEFEYPHLETINKTKVNAIYLQNKMPEQDRKKILVDSSRDAGIISILFARFDYSISIIDHQHQLLRYRYISNFNILFYLHNFTSSE
jgi:hypothetical protein